MVHPVLRQHLLMRNVKKPPRYFAKSFGINLLPHTMSEVAVASATRMSVRQSVLWTISVATEWESWFPTTSDSTKKLCGRLCSVLLRFSVGTDRRLLLINSTDSNLSRTAKIRFAGTWVHTTSNQGRDAVWWYDAPACQCLHQGFDRGATTRNQPVAKKSLTNVTPRLKGTGTTSPEAYKKVLFFVGGHNRTFECDYPPK